MAASSQQYCGSAMQPGTSLCSFQPRMRNVTAHETNQISAKGDSGLDVVSVRTDDKYEGPSVSMITSNILPLVSCWRRWRNVEEELPVARSVLCQHYEAALAEVTLCLFCC